MIGRKKPTKEDIDKIIEIYHNHSTKDITIEMVKEGRQKTFLGLADVKKILREYVNTLKE